MFQCDRLWVLDTGTFGIGNTTQNPCPYALNIFDLQTNTRIHRYFKLSLKEYEKQLILFFTRRLICF